MTKFKMSLPLICLGCPFQADDTCVLSGRMITEEYLYDKRPDHCYLTDTGDGWVMVDNDKMPDDAVIKLDMTGIDSFSSIEPI